MPKKVDHSARREEFLQAAYRVIKRDGFAGVTVRAVAKEAGFTTGALVHYVDSMDQLLVEASEYAARDVREKMLEVEALPDSLISMREVLYLALPSDADMQRAEALSPLATLPLWSWVAGRYTEWLKRTARMIRRAQTAGDIADDVNVALASRSCVALIDGIATMTLRSGKPLTPKQQRELIDAWMIAWLRPTRAIGMGERRGPPGRKRRAQRHKPR